MKVSKFKIVVFISLLLVFANSVFAHEMRPALLQIKQTSETKYDIIWKIPRLQDKIISIKPQFPAWFTLKQKGIATESGSGALYFFEGISKKNIHGMPFSVTGLKETLIDVVVQIELKNGDNYSLMIQPSNNNCVIPTESGTWDTIKGYFILGVEHIWSGIDHLLFVLALLLITKGMKKLLTTVTAFTIAHSITLSLAALGYVGLPGPPVEAVIALSIVFLAVEIIRDLNGIETLTANKPWLVAFTFGLLHGLGFASALAKIGLPQQNIPLALAFFNVGVEVGQILFILVSLLIIRVLAIKKDWTPWTKRVPAYGIGSLAAFWLIERVVAFWN